MFVALLLAAIAIALAFYYHVLRPLDYWKRKNAPQRSAWRQLSSLVRIYVWRRPLIEDVVATYKEFADKRYVGTFAFGARYLLIRDVDLIKQIAVKDFDHFTDHRAFFQSASVEPLWVQNLIGLKGNKWRQMRAALSPHFTSSKIRGMFALIAQCAAGFVDYYATNPRAVAEFDLVDALTRYTNDVIATTAFGVRCDSLRDRDNAFYRMGKRLHDPLHVLKFTCIVAAPRLAKFFGLRIFNTQVTDFFLDLVRETIATRDHGNVARPDIINLLMEARNASKPEDGPNATEIAAHALSFFFAGFDTVSHAMFFVAYELARNASVQARLQREIDETWRACGGGDLTYESLVAMKYMDMVVAEALRLWPNPNLDRACVKPYTIAAERGDERPIRLAANDLILIPVFAIHRDPLHYADPETFDPERFGDANRRNIRACTYMPFGVGPRNCIGSRLALLEIKVLLFHLLARFDLTETRTASDEGPMELCANHVLVFPADGFHVGLKLRPRD